MILQTYHEIKKRNKISYRFSKSINYSKEIFKYFQPKINVFYRLNNLVIYKDLALDIDVLFCRWLSFKNSIILKSLFTPLNFLLLGKEVLKNVSCYDNERAFAWLNRQFEITAEDSLHPLTKGVIDKKTAMARFYEAGR